MMKRFNLVSLLSLLFLGSYGAYAATLPPEEEMRKALIKVLDESKLRTEYYPLLLQHAGSEKNPQQVVDMFDQETERFLSTMSPYGSKMVRVQIVPYIPLFIKAILAHAPDEAEEAIQIHKETNRPPREKSE
jgi:hypothetical protein